MFIGEILKIIFRLIVSVVVISISVVYGLIVLGPIIGITNTLALFAAIILGSIVGGLIYVIKKL